MAVEGSQSNPPGPSPNPSSRSALQLLGLDVEGAAPRGPTTETHVSS